MKKPPPPEFTIVTNGKRYRVKHGNYIHSWPEFFTYGGACRHAWKEYREEKETWVKVKEIKE